MKRVDQPQHDASGEHERDWMWRDHAEMCEILERDLTPFRRRQGKPMSQSGRRAFVRALLTLIEADAAWKSRYVVAAWAGILGEDERRQLLGYRLTKSSAGNAIEVRSHRSPADRLFDAFALFAETSGSVSPIRKTARGWHDLKIALTVRNRVTHPRLPGDLTVSDRELAAVYRADQWFHEVTVALHEDCAASLLQTAAQYRRRLMRDNRSRPQRANGDGIVRALQLMLDPSL